MKRKSLMPLIVLLTMVCLLLLPAVASADTAASITFTTPKSTDVIMVGGAVTVNWTWNGDPGPLQFTLVDNDGHVKAYIANNVAKSSGMTNMRFTVPAKDDYNWYAGHKIVARTMNGNKFVAQSASFKIRAPEITVTLPSAGFVWKAGTASTIKWSSEIATGTGKIELVRNNQVVQVISPSLPINQGSLAWTPPTTLSSSYDDKEFIIRVWNDTVGTWGDSAPFKLDLTPDPPLANAIMQLYTTSENKSLTTVVSVSVISSTSPEKKIAWGNSPVAEYIPGSAHIIPVQFDPAARKSAFATAKVTVGAKAVGNDLWTFNGILILSFADGSKIVKQSAYERVLNSLQSQYVEVDLQGPAMAKPAATTTPTTQPASGKTTALLTKSSNTASPHYGMNYYTGTCLYPGNPNAKITGVKNNSNSLFTLWFTDRLNKQSSQVTLAPGQSTGAFNGMSAWGGLWEAAMTLPYPSSASLEITWSAP